MKCSSGIIVALLMMASLALNCTSKKTESHEASAPFTLAISGAMRNVMHDGELFGTISLDTISNKTHLYGVGPIEYLTGEVLIIDGKSYTSVVTSDTTMQVSENYTIKAPFFVYANVPSWKEYAFPDSLQSIKQVEDFLNATVTDIPRPFPFRMTCTVDSASIHIVNLPKGSEVHSPDDAHEGQVKYTVLNTPVELVGFFSTEHKGVFIHHDSFVHVHLITNDRMKMGHVDSLMIQRGTGKLYLPGVKEE